MNLDKRFFNFSFLVKTLTILFYNRGSTVINVRDRCHLDLQLVLNLTSWSADTVLGMLESSDRDNSGSVDGPDYNNNNAKTNSAHRSE